MVTQYFRLPATRLALAFTFSCILGLTGCSLFTSQGGEILISRPEVFTRQRLVNRRLAEQQWLETQLATTPTTQTFQGLQDIRIFDGFYNKTGVTFDPLAGKTAVAQNNLNMQSLQIEMAKLQQQLAAVKNSATDTSGASAGSTGSGSPPAAVDPAPNSPPGAPTPTSSGILSNAPVVPSPELVTTQAKLTSNEFLRDQLAYRNAVQAALREQELDDSHDLEGLTLYTLKFDVSIIPHGNKNDGLAKVELDLSQQDDKNSVAKSPDCKAIKEIYESWFWNLRIAINAEAVALQQRLEQGLLSQEEKLRLAARAASAVTVTTETMSYIDALSKSLKVSETERARRAPGSFQEAKRGAAQLVRAKYAVTLKGLVFFASEPDMLEINIGETSYYVPNMPSERERVECPASLHNNGILHAFYKAIDEGRTNATVFVADPKEEAQNISDVAATEKLRNLVLSLQAVIPQYGVDASNYAEYMRRSQERLQAISRRPLVVAYANGGEKFGWILGPRFEIGPDQTVQFSHTTVQRSVQASLVVPGWTRTLNIDYKTFWVDRHGKSRLVDQGTLPVKLPGDATAITAKLLAASGERRLPFIEPPTNSAGQRQVIRLQAKQPADLLIRGRHLWRNPKVFIGAQAADAVTVLPDMNGLSAHFNSLTLPPDKSYDNLSLDLSVVTSEGIAVLHGGVEIFSDVPKPKSTDTSSNRPQPNTRVRRGNKEIRKP